MTIVSAEPTQIPESRGPISDIDPYSDAALIEPWDAYREARSEMAAIFRALAIRVKRFNIESETRAIDNILRGFSKLIVSVE